LWFKVRGSVRVWVKVEGSVTVRIKVRIRVNDSFR
jgi:hypothetical protein